MEKIIIVLHKVEHDPRLIELMKVLFPESEIQTVIRKEEGHMAGAKNSSWGDPHGPWGKRRP